MFNSENQIPHGKTILDACCGARMFWFNKEHPDVLFADIRRESIECCDGRHVEIDPDLKIDFRNMPFENNTFKMVVFDPPHMNDLGENSWLAQKYGRLLPSWEDDIKQGFSECFRVLVPGGTLIFKWNETQIPVSKILELTDYKPLFGHKSGKNANTHWIAFTKSNKLRI